jgi:hypothetical protein
VSISGTRYHAHPPISFVAGSGQKKPSFAEKVFERLQEDRVERNSSLKENRQTPYTAPKASPAAAVQQPQTPPTGTSAGAAAPATNPLLERMAKRMHSAPVKTK